MSDARARGAGRGEVGISLVGPAAWRVRKYRAEVVIGFRAVGPKPRLLNWVIAGCHLHFFAASLCRIKGHPSIMAIGGVCAARLFRGQAVNLQAGGEPLSRAADAGNGVSQNLPAKWAVPGDDKWGGLRCRSRNFAASLCRIKGHPSIMAIGGVCAARLFRGRVGFPSRRSMALSAS
jgi:hypothetical protein